MDFYTLDKDHNVIPTDDYPVGLDRHVQKTFIDLKGNLLMPEEVKLVEQVWGGKAVSPEQLEVSTVFLALDHGNGEPLVFETMCFSGDFTDLYCRRYSTWQQAMDGHFEVVGKIVNVLKTGKITDFKMLEIE